MNKSREMESSVVPLQPLLKILRSEVRLWLPIAVVVFFAASLLMSGWSAGLLPNTQYPYIYSGDGLFNQAMIKRLMEGSWYFDNARSGFPFGSNVLDFQGSDAGSFVVLKLLGMLFGSFQAAHNLYFLLGFSVTFIVSYGVLRVFRITMPLAVAGAIVFSFQPFHFLRVGHIFYTWYFVVPLYFYYCYYLYSGGEILGQGKKWQRAAGHAAVLLVAASFGVYYAFFGVLILLLSALAGAIRFGNIRRFYVGVAAAAVISLGVLINISPALYYSSVHGKNHEVAARAPMETELYGLKLSQLLLPRYEHRIASFSRVQYSYNTQFPVCTENYRSSLGLIGAFGLILLLSVTLINMAGRRIDFRLALLALITVTLFLFATVGGLSSLFAVFVTPLIRAWNRASIFIGFASVAAACVFFEAIIRKRIKDVWLGRSFVVFAVGISVFGVWDQTSRTCTDCNDALRVTFEQDRAFINNIESAFPVNSAIYQLPYMAFPETAPKHKLLAYDLDVGFLHSKTLRWSHAGIKGREGDFFFRTLAQQPMQRQLDVVRKAGFSGIYIDRRGYEDGGRAIESELMRLLGKGPQFIRGDGEIAFYQIIPDASACSADCSPEEIMIRSGFYVDQYGVRYHASLDEGVDLRRPDLPIFVKSIQGLSSQESWGRWTDSNLSRSLVIVFKDKLPSRFTLVLQGKAFGPNVAKPVQIKVGDKLYSAVFAAELEEKRIYVESVIGTNVIEMLPPSPISPKAFGGDLDTRRLGIGLAKIQITQ